MLRSLLRNYGLYKFKHFFPPNISLIRLRATTLFSLYFHQAVRKGLLGTGFGGAAYSLSFFGKKSETTVNRESDINSIITVADVLYKDYLIDQAYQLLERHSGSGNAEILWRFARVICEKGKKSEDINEKKKLFNEALETASKALENEPPAGSFGAHKWYAIILNYASSLEGTKEQILKSFDVKAHIERALEIDAFDPTTWHILGMWHYHFSDVSSSKRWAARILYAKLPETSYEEALRNFERAEALQPNFYSTNHYYLGLTYGHLNRKEESLMYMKKAFLSPILTEDDKEAHVKAGEYLKTNYKALYEELTKEMREQPGKSKI